MVVDLHIIYTQIACGSLGHLQSYISQIILSIYFKTIRKLSKSVFVSKLICNMHMCVLNFFHKYSDYSPKSTQYTCIMQISVYSMSDR